MARLYLLLGANLGEPKKQLIAASKAIQSTVGKITQCSAIYSTEAWGTEDEQPEYLNQVLEIQTDLEPSVVLERTQAIEKKLGRVRNKKWEARIIDVDILFYDDWVIDSPLLSTPHPYFHVRNFALIPMNEIAPAYIHPLLNKSVRQLLEESPDILSVKLLHSQEHEF